jgi:hypothetical protein
MQQQQQQPQPPQPQQSQLQQSHPPPSAAQLARLTDKKKEFEAVEALQRASALFLRRLEGLADDCEAMAEAGIGARFSPEDRKRGPFFLIEFKLFFSSRSAWPGARSVAADVPYPEHVWYVIFCFCASLLSLLSL